MVIEIFLIIVVLYIYMSCKYIQNEEGIYILMKDSLKKYNKHDAIYLLSNTIRTLPNKNDTHYTNEYVEYLEKLIHTNECMLLKRMSSEAIRLILIDSPKVIMSHLDETKQQKISENLKTIFKMISNDMFDVGIIDLCIFT